MNFIVCEFFASRCRFHLRSTYTQWEYVNSVSMRRPTNHFPPTAITHQQPPRNDWLAMQLVSNGNIANQTTNCFVTNTWCNVIDIYVDLRRCIVRSLVLCIVRFFVHWSWRVPAEGKAKHLPCFLNSRIDAYASDRDYIKLCIWPWLHQTLVIVASCFCFCFVSFVSIQIIHTERNLQYQYR